MSEVESLFPATGTLLQLRVLGLGVFQYGDVGVGVLPKSEEVVIRGAGFGGVALHRIGSTQLDMSKCAQWAIRDYSAMVEKFLKLCYGIRPSMEQ